MGTRTVALRSKMLRLMPALDITLQDQDGGVPRKFTHSTVTMWSKFKTSLWQTLRILLWFFWRSFFCSSFVHLSFTTSLQCIRHLVKFIRVSKGESRAKSAYIGSPLFVFVVWASSVGGGRQPQKPKQPSRTTMSADIASTHSTRRQSFKTFQF